ncbi:MAG: type II toxin-antitoxin system RelE/ParE family toxin [Bacteroidales bacterium]|nr:type II toxin-antitoxin system RelE/ParE family toxin [Bacteroidales bacterium]
MRKVFRSAEFDEFYSLVDSKVQDKIDYVVHMITTIAVVNAKFVKKLIDTPFYELRISVENEYRIILFTMDKASFIEAKEVYLLNGFLKKSTKDYYKQIDIADKILRRLSANIKDEK